MKLAPLHQGAASQRASTHGSRSQGAGPCSHGALQGEEVQVDPIKPVMKPPGIESLKLKFDELLSSFAFRFKLRHYNEVSLLDNRLMEKAFVEEELKRLRDKAAAVTEMLGRTDKDEAAGKLGVDKALAVGTDE